MTTSELPGRIEVRLAYLFDHDGSLTEAEYQGLSTDQRDKIRGRLLNKVAASSEKFLEYFWPWSQLSIPCEDHEPQPSAWELVDGHLSDLNNDRQQAGKDPFELGTVLHKICLSYGTKHRCVWGYDLLLDGVPWTVSHVLTSGNDSWLAVAKASLDLVIEMPLSHYGIMVPVPPS